MRQSKAYKKKERKEKQIRMESENCASIPFRNNGQWSALQWDLRKCFSKKQSLVSNLNAMASNNGLDGFSYWNIITEKLSTLFNYYIVVDESILRSFEWPDELYGMRDCERIQFIWYHHKKCIDSWA